MRLTTKRIAESVAGFLMIFSSQVFAGQIKQYDAVPGEYIVRLKPQNKMLMMNTMQLSTRLGAYIKSTIPGQNIIVVKKPVFESTHSALKSLAINSLVDVVEPNYIYKANATPNDPMLNQLWGMKNLGQADSDGKVGVAGVDIDAEKAWDIETGSDKMLVAVIDTGINFNHPDLVDNLWTNQAEAEGKEGVDDDNNGVIDDIHGFNAITGNGDAQDDQGHGSHCAGTIGAKGNDGKGIVGVNWNTQLMAVKFLDKNGSGSLENALKAIDYATKMGAKVMSNSWGGGGFSQTLLDSIKRSNEAGAIFLAAAGNESNNNDKNPSYPASYDVPNIISVAAIDNKGARASFSNFGKRTVHLGAPGVNIYSSTGGAYDSWSGTSMATPHVSGIAALVWSHEPQLTAVELKQRLMKTVRPISGLKGKTVTGGLINAYNALVDKSAEPDLNDPQNWLSVPADYQSASPYMKNTNEVFEVNSANGQEFSLYFEKFDTEANYDVVKIYDEKGVLIQTLSGSNDDIYSAPISGTYAKIVFTSDESVEKNGWRITKIAYR